MNIQHILLAPAKEVSLIVVRQTRGKLALQVIPKDLIFEIDFCHVSMKLFGTYRQFS